MRTTRVRMNRRRCTRAVDDARERMTRRRCAQAKFVSGKTLAGKIVDKEDQLTDTDEEEDVVVHKWGGRARKGYSILPGLKSSEYF